MIAAESEKLVLLSFSKVIIKVGIVTTKVGKDRISCKRKKN